MRIANLSLLFDSRFAGIHWQDLETIIKNWGIYKFGARKISEGATRSNWLIRTIDRKYYVLRNAGADLEWLTWQIAVLERLIKNNFPYSIPHPLPGKSGNQYYLYKTDYWIFYQLIPGELLGFQPSMNQAFNVGRMVGEYHQAIRNLEHHSMFEYELKLFEKSTFSENMQAIFRTSAQFCFKDPEIEQFIQYAPLFQQAYDHILSSDILSIKNLPKLPVHYDLHGKNILCSGDRIVGLIDFDALGIGPRIIDFQNALIYMSGGSHGIDLSKAKSFVDGYYSAWPLSVDEIELIYPLMIERLMTLVTQVIGKKSLEVNKTKLVIKSVLGFQDRYTRDLLLSLVWVINNKNLFIDTALKKPSFFLFQ